MRGMSLQKRRRGIMEKYEAPKSKEER